MRIELHFGNIEDLLVDGIVNAAKPSLLGGGGVDGAIHKKAGPELSQFCRSLNGCKVGEAKLSPGFNLPARNIIHTVGPRYLFKTQKEEDDLKQCYNNSLLIASELKFRSLAFPNISTGAYGYPKDLASRIAFETTMEFMKNNVFPEKVIFCCYDLENLDLYIDQFKTNII